MRRQITQKLPTKYYATYTQYKRDCLKYGKKPKKGAAKKRKNRVERRYAA